MNPLLPTEASSDLPAERLSAGQMLRAAREAQGLHLAVLSVNLKVSVRQLEALEADQHGVFKGAAFVRALAQSVCRQLKIDPAPVLAALPQAVAPKTLEPVSLASRQAAAHPSPRSASTGLGNGLSRQVMLLAVLMLVGVAALIWWPSPTKETLTEETQDPAQAAVPMGQASDPVESAAVPASAELPVPVPVPVPVPAAATASAASVAVPAAQAPASAPVVVASAAPARVSAPTSAAAQVAQEASGAVAADAPLVLRLTADAWVEVRDSRGQMALRRVVKAGETLKLHAMAPLFVYVGRADSAELSWQGKRVDLQPHTQNNEARLQLKP